MQFHKLTGFQQKPFLIILVKYNVQNLLYIVIEKVTCVKTIKTICYAYHNNTVQIRTMSTWFEKNLFNEDCFYTILAMWTNVLNEYKKNLVKYFRKFENIFRVESTYIQDDNNVSIFHHISKIMISVISRYLCVYCCWFPRLLQLVIHLFSTIAIIDVSIVSNWFNVLRHYISGWIDTWSKF